MSFYKIKRTPADVWFSYLVRFRDGWKCQNCGAVDYARRFNREESVRRGQSIISCAHIFSRGNSIYNSTRHDPENAVSLCGPCHDKFSHNSEGWERWYKLRLGKKFNRLLFKSRQVNHKLKYFFKEFTEEIKKQVIKAALNSDRMWIIRKDLTSAERKKYGV